MYLHAEPGAVDQGDTQWAGLWEGAEGGPEVGTFPLGPSWASLGKLKRSEWAPEVEWGCLGGCPGSRCLVHSSRGL